jgi:hypothetical protein
LAQTVAAPRCKRLLSRERLSEWCWIDDVDELRAHIARWLGVTTKTVRELAKADIVVRAGRGLYKLEESVTGYCEHIRRTASQRGGEASLATLRDERITGSPRSRRMRWR